MPPGNPFPRLLRHLCWETSALYEPEQTLWLRDGSLFLHCVLRRDGERFPKQSERQCQLFPSPAVPDNGHRAGAPSQKEGGALPSWLTTERSQKDGFRIINGWWLEIPASSREAQNVHRSPCWSP